MFSAQITLSTLYTGQIKCSDLWDTRGNVLAQSTSGYRFMVEAALTKSSQRELHLKGWLMTHEILRRIYQRVNILRGTSAIVHVAGADFLREGPFQPHARQLVHHLAWA